MQKLLLTLDSIVIFVNKITNTQKQFQEKE
jgi:hypothetical protein